ncbi:MAG: TPM domain-containing protein [Chitinophagia bacterium]|nr:TPM domain-containing protein [Chitinophagia bacterium]
MLSLFRKKEQLSKAVQKKVAEHIKLSEQKTSGEIRVFVESDCLGDPLQRAREVFSTLGMEKTTARNAILIYLAFNHKKFALFGDEVIFEKAGGPAFWQSAADKLKEKLKVADYAGGICDCIDELGKELALHFPYDPAVKKNELPDEIVFGK